MSRGEDSEPPVAVSGSAVSCSVGVARWSAGESAAEELLARAGEALYAAKNSGRDATFSLPAPGRAETRGSVPSG